MKEKLLKNKWLLATVLMALIAIAAIVVAIVLGTKGPEAPEAPTVDNVFGVGEEGVYYYEVVDGTVTLTLRDGTFTMSGKINKTGTYSVNGSAITLDFFKDEDGTATATLDGDTVALVYDNATMSFIKEIDYTVTFNVDGGSEIPALTVINGKFAEKPDADPTKDNHVFLGWYADDKFTTPFSFAETAVRSNITVYARWAEKKVGVPDYTVSFDLGYEGAAEIAPLNTVSGIAYGVPTPEREGYTFGGWWISMYEDADKLSYAYDEKLVFTADTTLYAVWHEKDSEKLQAPAVNVTENAISWAPVDNATSYKLTVVDPEGKVVIDNETVAGTIKSFEFGGKNPGEYKVSVVAVAQNAANNSAPADRYFANKALDRVSDFRVENGILIFGEVKNAQKYTITIDCGDDSHVHTDFDNGLSTTYYLANCKMQKGGILITVTASANGYASSVSNTFSYERNLDKIESVVYDEASDSFIWDAVPGALSYTVTVTVGGKDYTFDTDMRTAFSAAGFTGNIAVSVVPSADGYNSPEAATAACVKTAPVVPDGLSASGDKIFWNNVDGATSYEVNIGGQIITTAKAELTLADISGLTQGQSYTVKVKAINAKGESSAFSTEIKVGYFVMENTLKYSKNTVSWSPVLGVNRYMVRVNGGEAYTVTDATSKAVTLTKSGENLIEVCFVNGETTSDWVSIKVTAYTVEYNSRTPNNGITVEYLAPGDIMTLPAPRDEYDGYDFYAWYNIPFGSEGNGKKFESGALFSGTSYTVVYADWAPKTYEVTLNGVEGENGKANVTYTKDFTLLIPSSDSITNYYFFAGWYTGINGSGTQITDETGASLNPYGFTHNVTLYPFYATNTLSFSIQADDTYAVSRGSDFGTVEHIKIPVTYREKPVTTILESAFSSSALKTIEVPDTIKLVGANAFGGCSALTEINLYKAKDGVYETLYTSVDGVLFRNDVASGSVYLEFFPCGKTGTYTIPNTIPFNGKDVAVDKILAKAFRYAHITGIVIPNNIIDLANDTFYYCRQLESIEFTFGRTNNISFETAAFKECAAVKSIKFPKNLNIAEADLIAFLNGFKGLTAITVEDGGSVYGSLDAYPLLTNADKTNIIYAPRAFAAADGKFAIPAGVESISKNAFKSCYNLTSIVIPTFVKTIGESAFNDCKGVTEIIFKGGRSYALSIGTNAFAYNTMLKTVTFEGDASVNELDAGTITIGTGAFRAKAAENASIREVNIGANVNIKSIGGSAFINQSRLEAINISDKAYVGTIGASAFKGCSNITAITIPETVTSIGSNAFEGCDKLKDVTFEEGTATLDIANYAFINCQKIVEITLPDRLGSFNATAFEGCDSLKAVKVKGTNKNYINDSYGILYKKITGSDALAEILFYPKGLARELNGVVNNLPETLTTIGGGAFFGNNYLKEIKIPASVTKIDTSAFEGCEKLTKVTFAENGTTLTVETKAFAGCIALTSEFMLPAYTKTIGTRAFEGCTFTEFTVPAGVTAIKKAAFINCVNLETVNFNCTGTLDLGSDATGGKLPVSTTSATKYDFNDIDGVFAYCTALKSVILPANTTKIGNGAFYGCTSLATVDLGDSLETIGNVAFRLCPAIESITFPKTVKSIGNCAFENTKDAPGSLKTATFERGGTADLTIGLRVFGQQAELTDVTFPARTVKLANAGVVAPAIYPSNNFNTADKNNQSYLKDIFVGCYALKNVNIDTEDGAVTPKTFASLNGVIYDKDFTTLIFCPMGNEGITYNGTPHTLFIPKTVTKVFTSAVFNTSVITTVTFEEFDKSDANYGKQLLTIGTTVPTSSTHNGYFTSSSSIFVSITGTPATHNKYNTITFGGLTTSIETINLPSHLKEINAGAFANNETETMTLNINPDADKLNIKNYAFIYSKFDKIVIPGTVESVGSYMFRSCALATEISVKFKEDLKELPEGLFYGCTLLGSNLDYDNGEVFEIPSHITAIGKAAFQNCKAIQAIDIHENITTLFDNAFYGSGIRHAYLHPGITKIGASAFYASSLRSFEFGLDENGNSPITEIPKSMFYGCTYLETINLDEIDLKIVRSQAFSNCKALQLDFTKLTQFETVEKEAFKGCQFEVVDLRNTKLTNFGIAGTGNTSHSAFQDNANLKVFYFPDGLTQIGTSAFQNCFALNEIHLPASFDGKFLKYLFNTNVDHTPVNFVIHPDNPYLVKDEYGVVYSADHQFLYSAAKQNLPADWTMHPDTLYVEHNSFVGVVADTIQIGPRVQYIGYHAFYHAQVKEVIVSASVEKIYDLAFGTNNYSDLYVEAVTFEEGSKLKFIAGSIFSNNHAIKEVILPEGLDLVGSVYCNNSSFTVSEKATTQPATIFNNCSALERVVFGAATTVIPTKTFQKCTSLSDIRFQNNVKTINALMAGGTSLSVVNKELKTITIPASVTTFADSIFVGFTGLETVNFENGSKINSIPKNAFYGCAKLNSLNLPSTLTTIGDSAFQGCASLNTVDFTNTALSSVGAKAFYNNANLVGVKFPNTLKTIGASAFYGIGAAEIYIPANVESIGASAFENSGITTLTFSAESALSALGDIESVSAAFKNTKSLKTVTISNDLAVIGNNAFEGSAVEKVLLANPEAPSALREIGEHAFFECFNLTDFHAFENTTSIGDYAFYACSQLKQSNVGDLDYLGGMAFGLCTSIPEARIPASLTTLGGNPYAGVDGSKVKIEEGNKFYKAITDENGAITIYDMDESIIYAVYGAKGEYVFGEFVLTVKPNAFAGNAIESVSIPSSLGTITNGMFMDCKTLKTVTIGEKISTIEDYAFYGCTALDNVVIPGNVTFVGNYAFANCDSLTNFEYAANPNVVELGTHIFYNSPSIKEVELPKLFKTTEAERTRLLGASSTTSLEDTISSYMFAGTGIVNAVIPANVRFFYTEGLFADCKKLETITFLSQQTNDPISYPNAFYAFGKDWTKGCESFKYAYIDDFKTRAAYFVNHLDMATDINVLYVKTLKTELFADGIIGSAKFNYVSDDFELHFVEDSYEELIPKFKNLSYSWNFKVYDKDGNRLISSQDTSGGYRGRIVSVVDKDGKVIWSENAQ